MRQTAFTDPGAAAGEAEKLGVFMDEIRKNGIRKSDVRLPK
jgi:hypothetical protein